VDTTLVGVGTVPDVGSTTLPVVSSGPEMMPPVTTGTTAVTVTATMPTAPVHSVTGGATGGTGVSHKPVPAKKPKPVQHPAKVKTVSVVHPLTVFLRWRMR
jgi:hypothetical protein